MNLFNRVILVSIGIIILIGAILVLLVATGIVMPDVLPGGIFLPYLQNVAAATGNNMVINIGVSALVALAMILLIIFEITSAVRKPAPQLISMTDDNIAATGKAMNKHDILIISSTEKGATSIDIQSLCDLAENVGITVNSVNRFDCRIGRNSEGLILSCRAVAVLGSNVAEVAAKSRSRITEAIEQLTGLKVAKVDIKIVYDKSKKGTEPLTVH